MNRLDEQDEIVSKREKIEKKKKKKNGEKIKMWPKIVSSARCIVFLGFLRKRPRCKKWELGKKRRFASENEWNCSEND